jgi:hypothetical protein
VVKTDMSESDPSNVATATPIDTIPPVISHTPVTEAPPGLPLTLYADVTDNVGVQGVTLLLPGHRRQPVHQPHDDPHHGQPLLGHH